MKPLLIDLLHKGILFDFEKKIEEKDEYGYDKMLHKEQEKLFEELSKEQIQKVEYLLWLLNSKLDHIYFESKQYLLTHAFYIGMEMQHAFDNEDYT